MKKTMQKLFFKLFFMFSNYYYYFSCISNFTKKRRLYKHIWTYFIYICLYIFLYT